MNREKEREYQENLAYLKDKMPNKEVELPMKLQAEMLKQRALAGEKATNTAPNYRWKNAVAMACALVMIAGIGIFGSMNRPSAVDMAAGNTAPASMKAAPEMQSAAYSPAPKMAPSNTFGSHYEVSVFSQNWEDAKADYSDVGEKQVHIFDENAGEFMLISSRPNGELKGKIVILGANLSVTTEEGCIVVSETVTNQQMKFDEITLERLQ